MMSIIEHSGATVLVVDDHEPARYVRGRSLEEAGFHVLNAASGDVALRIVLEQHPTIVVLDVVLPDTDGITICKAIKQNPDTANTMVLQVSAYYTSAADQVLGLDSGADAYLPGDIAPDLLTATVRALLRISCAENAVRDRNERLQIAEALRRSDQKLRALASHLFTAQEEERMRIARDVHDDFSQRLAALDFELRDLRERSPALCKPDLGRIIREVSTLSEDLRALSHSLHPSGLEHLGLDICLRRLCSEYEERHAIAMLYTSTLGTRRIEPAVGITFYRIAQEALRNVIKHAGDARVTVSLSGTEEELSLTIQDDGYGFDPCTDAETAGLGLISMEERAKSVHGHMDLRSVPGQGTTLTVRAPCKSRSNID